MILKICIGLFLSNSFVLGSPASNYNVQSLGKSSELFALDLYQQLSKEDGSILASPISLQTILALSQMGANGQTLNEMSRALSLPVHKPSVQHAFRELSKYNRDVKHAKFSSASKIVIKKGFDLAPNFTQIAVNSFEAEVETRDFNDPESTAYYINRWVESKTNSKIKELITPKMVTPVTVMILLNALYFKGTWKTTFDKDATHKKDFYIDNKKSRVEMMVNSAICKYAENKDLDAQFLELPYAGDEFAMTFILPKTRGNLTKIEQNLKAVFDGQNMEEVLVDYYIPKFTIEQTQSYKDVLENLGMIEAFREDADFSDCTVSNSDLFINAVVQKTFIDVNEEGTEAAAASAAYFDTRISENPPTFLADHPFIFVLRQSKTGIVQFIGRYSGPD